MAIDMDYYLKIQNMYNCSDLRDSQKYEVKMNLNTDFNNTLDAYSVLVGGIAQDLTIIKTQDLSIKKIKSRPGEYFYSGQVVQWANAFWLIEEFDSNTDLLTYGKMHECNYLLKWQNAFGAVIERHCVESRISTIGIDDNKVVQIGKSQSKLLVPYDSETIKLRVGKRLYIDNNLENPTPYMITLANTTSYVKNGHGYLELIVTESATIPDVDRPDLMLCNYISPAPPDPEPTTKQYTASISCLKPEIAVGKYGRTFTAVFKDADGNAVTTITPKWTVTSTFTDKLTFTEGSNYIKIVTADTNLIDKTFMLKLEAADDSAEPVEISILITSIYG